MLEYDAVSTSIEKVDSGFRETSVHRLSSILSYASVLKPGYPAVRFSANVPGAGGRFITLPLAPVMTGFIAASRMSISTFGSCSLAGGGGAFGSGIRVNAGRTFVPAA